jgi:hypothetical protein
MYISEWDLHGAALRLLPAACHRKIYTQGHGIPPCIYQNGIYTVRDATTSSLYHKENIRRTWHSSMYISEWDLRCRHYYQQLVPRTKISKHH